MPTRKAPFMDRQNSEEKLSPQQEQNPEVFTSAAEAALALLIGRKISGITIRMREKGTPACQLLFKFSDGSVQEFYAESGIKPAKGLREEEFFERKGDGVDVVRVG